MEVLTVSIHRLQKTLKRLCEHERVPSSAEHHRTQMYLCDAIETLGHLAIRQPFWRLPFGKCVNIVAETGPAEGPRFVVGAHYDTLRRSGQGADDNASGVAVTLELLRQAPENIPMTFVFFDYEEDVGFYGTQGARHFLHYYNKPLRQAIVFDLVGGAIAPGFEQAYFQFGTGLTTLTSEKLTFFHLPIRVLEPLGPWFPRSDYHPFRKKGLPFTFFSSGTPWYYHSCEDTPDRLDLNKMMGLVEGVLAVLTKSPEQTQGVDWTAFAEDLGRLQGLPAFNTPFLRKMRDLGRDPSWYDIIRLHVKVFCKLKMYGPALWRMT